MFKRAPKFVAASLVGFPPTAGPRAKTGHALRWFAGIMSLGVVGSFGVAVADRFVPGQYGDITVGDAWNGLAKISVCDDQVSPDMPEEQGCQYFTITRSAQGDIDPAAIEGDQPGFETAVAADATCRLEWQNIEGIGAYGYMPNQIRVRFYVPGTDDLLPVSTTASGWSRLRRHMKTA